MSILDRVPGIMAKAMGETVFRAGVLKVPGERVSNGQGGWIAGPPTLHPCRALVDDFSAYRRAAGDIAGNDRKIIILAATLDVEPKVGHTINAEGRDWQIIALTRDPAGATYEVQGR